MNGDRVAVGAMDRFALGISRAGDLAGAERIKLFSTRSFWWTCALMELLVVGPAALLAMLTPAGGGPEGAGLVSGTEFVPLGGLLILVLAAGATTDEYRHHTVRATFLAAPGRTSVLLAKAAVVAGAAGVLGLLVAFGGRGVAALMRPGSGLALVTADQWRSVAGTGLVFAVTALVAVAVGILVRNSGGALALLLGWVLAGEAAVTFIPKVGADVYAWLPFANLGHFLALPGDAVLNAPMRFGPWGAVSYATAVAVALLAVALLVARRRDA